MKPQASAAVSVRSLAALIAACSCSVANAQIDGVGDDGWFSWRVAAVDPAPEWCCHEWNRGRPTPSICNLDSRRGNYGNHSDRVNPTGQMQVYVYMQSGRTEKIRTLSPRCAVASQSTIADLGLIDSDTSVTWIAGVLDAMPDDALASIAVHAGRQARDTLVQVAASDDDVERREEAIFWMAQVRFADSGDEVRRLMFDDDDPDIREHAAFAYSQTSATDRVDALVQQGRQDPDADVRAQAWFWLAETEAPQSEAEISKAITTDASEEVREEAVFALSQLPADRAVRALVEVIENTSLDADLRQEALFWLAQTESDQALDYIERLLSGS